MKKSLLRVIFQMAFYSITGLVFQAFVANMIFATYSLPGQNLKEVKVNIQMENVTLKKVLEKIEDETDFKFFYAKEEIPYNHQTSIVVDNQPLEDVLEELAEQHNLVFQRINKQIVIKKAQKLEEKKILNDDKKIKGKLIDENGEPLPFANIIIKGTSKGTATDNEGKFKLLIPTDAKIIICSYVGYVPAEVDITKGNNFEITLIPQNIGLDGVVVYGQRLSNAKAIAEKKDRTQISDGISSNEIGSLPDFNAGEAIRRLPGVMVDNDQAEARSITIRGFNSSYYNTNLDGVQVPSMNKDNRSIPMDVFSSSMLGKIEVIKSVTPDLDGNAVGGQINMVSRSPFDAQRQFFSASGSIGMYGNNAGYNGTSTPSGVADVVYTNRFGDKGEWGILASGNYYRRDSYQPRLESSGNYTWFDAGGKKVDPYTQNSFPFPNGRRWIYYDNLRQRYGTNLKIDYKPSERLHAKIGYYYQVAFDDETRMDNQVYLKSAKGPATKKSLDILGKYHQVQMGRFNFNRNITSINAALDMSIGKNGLMNVLGAYTKGHFEEPQVWDAFRYANVEGTYNKYEDHFTFTPKDKSAYSDGNNYLHEKREINDQKSDEKTIQLKFDYGYNALSQDRGFGFKLGAKFTGLNRVYDYSRDRYKKVKGSGFTLTDVISENTDYKAPIGGENGEYLAIDASKIDSYYDKNKNNTNIFKFSDESSTDISRDYEANENVLAGYLMGTYKADLFNAIFGVRYENTSFDSKGHRKVNGKWQEGTNDGKYGNLLPSITLGYYFKENVILRGAYNKTLGRPNFTDFAVRGEDYRLNDQDILTVKRSNPDLKPRVADNFDLSFEWYLAEIDGIASVALFHKNIKDEIFTKIEDQLIDWNGTLTNAIVKQKVNIESVKVTGIELGFTKTFTFLPAPFNRIGTIQNFTYTSPDWQIIMKDGTPRKLDNLKNQTNITYNGVLYYEGEKLQIRLAAYSVGKYLSSFRTSSDYRDRYVSPRTQLDLKITYKLLDNFSIYTSIWNLTNSKKELTIGRDQELFEAYRDWGRSAFVGFNYSL